VKLAAQGHRVVVLGRGLDQNSPQWNQDMMINLVVAIALRSRNMRQITLPIHQAPADTQAPFPLAAADSTLYLD
jgi:hypothetical protein